MSITTQTEAVKVAIAALGTKIRDISLKADNAPDAQKLEGYTVEQLTTLIAGTTESTVTDIETALNTFIARSDNPHNVTKAQVGLGSLENYGIATKVEAETGTATNKYVTPKLVKDSLSHFWADKVGTAPETLDTIDEIAAAITSNQSVIDSLNDAVATRATKTELTTAVSDLNTAIGALTKADIGLGSVENFGIATKPEAEAGTVDNKYMTPLKTKQAIDVESTTLRGLIGTKTDQTDHDALQTQVDTLTKADIGLGAVENYGIATSIEALETDDLSSSNAKYMTPKRTLEVRQAIEASVEQSLIDIETAFNDAIAAINA